MALDKPNIQIIRYGCAISRFTVLWPREEKKEAELKKYLLNILESRFIFKWLQNVTVEVTGGAMVLSVLSSPNKLPITAPDAGHYYR